MRPLNDNTLTTKHYFPSPSLPLPCRHLMQQVGPISDLQQALEQAQLLLGGNMRGELLCNVFNRFVIENLLSLGYIAVGLLKH